MIGEPPPAFTDAFFVGESVLISGANVAGYNGVFTVTGFTPTTVSFIDPVASLGAATIGTVTGLATFTYTLPTPAGTPITRLSEGFGSASTTVTATTAGTPPFVVGEVVAISGSNFAGYNGTFTVTGVSSTAFTFTDPVAGLAPDTTGTATRVNLPAVSSIAAVGSATASVTTTPDVGGTFYTSLGHNILGPNNNPNIFNPIPGSDLLNITAAQLKIGPLLNNGGAVPTSALLPNSVAINAGDNSLVTTNNISTDARGTGFPRISAGIVDIGAFENLQPTITSIDPSTKPEGSPSFTLTIFGTDFQSNATVTFNGVSLMPTTASSTSITVNISTALLDAVSGVPIGVPVFVMVPDGSGIAGETESSFGAIFTVIPPTSFPFSYNIPVPPGPSVFTATEGHPVSLTLQFLDPNAGGFSVTSGALPPNLSIDPNTGAISGTLTTTSFGNYPITVTGSDFGVQGATSLTIEVTGPSITGFNPTTAPEGASSVPFALGIDGTDFQAGGNTTVTVVYQTASGPATTTLIPTVLGNSSMTVNLPPALLMAQAADTFTVTVFDSGINGTLTSLPMALPLSAPNSLNFTYPANPQINFLGDTVSLTPSSISDPNVTNWTATGLPGGVTINPVNGVISGVLSSFGSFAVNVDASDLGVMGSTSFTWNITEVNVPPSFTPSGNETISTDFGPNPNPQTIQWATGVSPGANQASETVTFNVSNNDPGLFTMQPAIDPNGVLTYTLVPNASGTATVTVTAQNTGSGVAPNRNTSSPVVFTITAAPTNIAPSFTDLGNQSTTEGGTSLPVLRTVNNWATNISVGPSYEAWQTATFNVSNNNTSLFATQPAVSAATGALTYQPAFDVFGSATVTVNLQDTGGTANGGSNTSLPATFVITISQGPSFIGGPDQNLTEAGAPTLQTVTNWATDISSGTNQPGATVNFNVSNDNNALFSVQPAISPTGTLTYQIAPNTFGTANVTAVLHTTGGTGLPNSAPDTFKITVTGAPLFTPGPNETETVYANPAVSIPNWATNISAGPTTAGSLSFKVVNDNASLFTVQPTISPNGTLSFTTSNMIGTANVSAVLQGLGVNGQVFSSPVTFTITVNPVVTFGSANAVWISQVYRDVLKREIQPGEVTFWTTQLSNGESRTAVAEQIVNSTEFQTDYIQGLFNSYLGYSADVNGVTYYLQQFQQGASDINVKAQILASPAFFQLYGSTNNGWLVGVFKVALGRTLDSFSLNFWGSKLNGGESLLGVATEILQSSAAADFIVLQEFQALLGRSPGGNDYTYWANQLAPAAGTTGIQDLDFIASVLASPEYGFNATSRFYNSQPDQNWLNQVFLDTLGRSIDPTGTTFYITQIRSASTYQAVALSILSSQEYRSDEVTKAYQSILNTQPTASTVAFFVNYLNEGFTLEQVKAIMYGTAAFFTDSGGTNEDYISSLYLNILNRGVDKNGDTFFGLQLLNGTVSPFIIQDLSADPARESVALGVLTSQEAFGDLVAAGYQQFLRRSATLDNAIPYWTAQFLANMTDEQFYSQLLGSQEYYNKFSV